MRKIKRNEYNKWDELIANSPHGTIFHSTGWLTLCSKVLKKDLNIYGCFTNKNLVGGCSLFVYKLKGIFKIASSICAMTPYGGLVVKQIPGSARKQFYEYREILDSLCKLISTENFDSVQIVNSPAVLDIRPFKWNGWYSNVLYTYLLNLNNNFEEQISRDIKQNLKKAIKKGIYVEKLKDSTIHYKLLTEVFKRQNLKPPVTEEFFEGISRLLRDNDIGDMWIAKTPSGQVVASEIILWDNKRAYAWTVASDPQYRDSGASSLLDCSVALDLRSQGFKCINMMSANLPRLAKFATGFNPKMVPYYSVNKKREGYKLIKDVYDLLNRSGPW